MAKGKHPYYIKHNKLKLVAFRARIDKSKAIQRIARVLEHDGTSPHFTKCLRQHKPPTCSLLPQEAEAYGYKLPCRSQEEQSKNLNSASHHHKRITKFSRFKSSVAAALSNVGSQPSSSVVTTRGKSFEKVKELSHWLPLSKENLNRNVLKATRVAVTNSCKQYPSVLSRNVLDKYAHLFGLGKPVKLASNLIEFEEARLIEEDERRVSKFEQIRHLKLKIKHDLWKFYIQFNITITVITFFVRFLIQSSSLSLAFWINPKSLLHCNHALAILQLCAHLPRDL